MQRTDKSSTIQLMSNTGHISSAPNNLGGQFQIPPHHCYHHSVGGSGVAYVQADKERGVSYSSSRGPLECAYAVLGGWRSIPRKAGRQPVQACSLTRELTYALGIAEQAVHSLANTPVKLLSPLSAILLAGIVSIVQWLRGLASPSCCF